MMSSDGSERSLQLRLLLSLCLAGMVVLFVLQNAAMVQVRYLLWSTEMPRAALVFIVFAVGIVTGWLLRGHFSRRSRD